MPKTVTYDTLTTEGSNIWVDGTSGQVRLETHYQLIASTSGESVSRSKDTTYLLDVSFDTAGLPVNHTRKDVLLLLAQGLQSDLSAEELT